MTKESYFISSVSDFINKIMEINERTPLTRSDVSSMIFYRGQAKFEWGLVPRLYREGLFNEERHLISEFIRVAPHEFEGMGYFDTLVKMQHYGLPTRLLDTTRNPLVALFFACFEEKMKEEDGSVFIFPHIPVFTQNLKSISIIMNYVFEHASTRINIAKFNKIKEKYPDITRDYILNILTKAPFHAVLPKLNNPRIVNQDGTFLLFGMKVKNIIKDSNPSKELYEFNPLEITDVKDGWHLTEVFRVPHQYKNKIIKELELIGITRNKMLPELEYQAEFITQSIKYLQNRKAKIDHNSSNKK